jgi:hypothetical protein
VVFTAISPIIAVTISPIVIVPTVILIMATFTVGSLAVGPYTEVQLSERDRGPGGKSIASVFGECRNSARDAGDGGDEKCQLSHSNLLLSQH